MVKYQLYILEFGLHWTAELIDADTAQLDRLSWPLIRPLPHLSHSTVDYSAVHNTAAGLSATSGTSSVPRTVPTQTIALNMSATAVHLIQRQVTSTIKPSIVLTA